MAAGGVDHQLGNREGRDLVGALVQQALDLRFDFVQAADARAEDHAAAERIDPCEKSMPLSRTASMPATMANCVKRSIRLASLADM